MKKYTSLILIVLAVAILSSCNSYYYAIVRSDNDELPMNNDGTHTATKNGISVTYSFKDEGGNIYYEIANNTNDPLFVDWSRSVLIAEDFATQYKSNRANFSGEITTTTYRFTNLNTKTEYVSSTTGKASGTVTLPQNDLFIPPHAKVIHSPLSLSYIYSSDVFKNFSKKRATQNRGFSEENIPLSFRSYLTIINDRDQTHTVFENNFYISGVIPTSTPDFLQRGNMRQNGNTFRISVANRGVYILGWTLVGIASIAGIILLADKVLDTPELNH